MIFSENNSRMYNGTTYIENEDIPRVQKFYLNDYPVYYSDKIEFTTNELHSNESFCKDRSKQITGQ